MSPEELFNENYHIAEATVAKLFKDVKYICNKHGVDKEDLFQYAREALWESALQFDSTKGNRTFRNYAITNIRWSLLQKIRKDYKKFSFRGTGVNPKDIINKLNFISLDEKAMDDEEGSTYHELIGESVDYDGEAFASIIKDKMEQVLPPRIIELINLRVEGKSIQEIGKMYGITHQAVDQNIKNHRRKMRKVLKYELF